MDWIDWISKNQQVEELRQRQRQSAEMFPESMLAMQLANRLSGLQGDIGQFQLDTAQQQQPIEQFKALVSALGGSTGANAFVGQNPQQAQEMFGPSAVPMQGAQGTLPDVAREAGKRFYNTGPEVARNVNQAGMLMPLQLALERALQGGRERLADIHGRWGLAAAGAHAGASAAEHAKNREQQATSAAMGILTSMPALQGVGAVTEAAPQVKDSSTANTLIRQIGALRQQLDIAGQMSKTVGAAMGGDAAKINVLVDAQIAQIKSQLDAAHRQLFDKYWGPEAQKGTAPKINPFEPASPTSFEGYTP